MGAYDMHHDQEEGHERDFERDTAEEWKDRDNEEGYLGEADIETIANMYPALKARYSWYERKIPIEEREEGHRLQVGDLVVLDPRWRDKTLGNYTSNHGRLGASATSSSHSPLACLVSHCSRVLCFRAEQCAHECPPSSFFNCRPLQPRLTRRNSTWPPGC